MPPSTWKRVEARVAQYIDPLAGRRTPLSGSNSGHGTSADAILPSYPWLFVEVKHGRSVPPTWDGRRELYIATARLAQREGRYALLVLHPKGVRDVSDYPSLIEVHAELTNPIHGVIVQLNLGDAVRVLIAQQHGEIPVGSCGGLVR